MNRTDRTTYKTAARGRDGTVVSHNLPSALAGIDVLGKGGNALDAIIAMGFVAAVREVPMTSIGGVGVLLAHEGSTGTTTEINFYGQTPMGLRENVFVPYLVPGGRESLFGWQSVRDRLNERGFLSVGVPTYVRGMSCLHQRLGSLPSEQLLQPAISLARDGFAPDEEDTFHFAADLHHIQRFDEMRRIFVEKGIPVPDGFYQGTGIDVGQPDLATTIQKVAAGGADAFYHGALPHTIADEVQRGGGVLSAEDLARYEPVTGSGLSGSYRGYELRVPDGMTGGLTLLEVLAL